MLTYKQKIESLRAKKLEENQKELEISDSFNKIIISKFEEFKGLLKSFIDSQKENPPYLIHPIHNLYLFELIEFLSENKQMNNIISYIQDYGWDARLTSIWITEEINPLVEPDTFEKKRDIEVYTYEITKK